MDSLRYWVQQMHVDGFRFDLATVLGRGSAGFERDGPFFACVAQDPVLAGVKLIAEPWDIGPGGYQLGQFPTGWLEWNDRFRDTMRAFWLGGDCTRGEFARRLCASADLFQQRQRAPASSVNYIVSHDGFTLRDLVSYELRHNQANGEDNRDGHAPQPELELRPGGRDRRPRRAGAARAAAACAAGHHAAVPGHADAGGRRRTRPQPGWQQQPLLPGQPDHLDRLEPGRHGADGVQRSARAASTALAAVGGASGSTAGPMPKAASICAGSVPTARNWVRRIGTTTCRACSGPGSPAPGARGAPLMLLFNAGGGDAVVTLPAGAWRVLLDTARPEPGDADFVSTVFDTCKLLARSVVLLMRSAA